MRIKPQAERDAIDARAAAWPRPPSPIQRQALDRLAAGELVVTVAGWQQRATDVVAFQTQTLEALERQGLLIFVRRGGRRRAARITRKGREEAHRGRLRRVAGIEPPLEARRG